MTKGKTTRQILQEKETTGKSVPLYNPAALQKIKEDFDCWLKETVAATDRENWSTPPHTTVSPSTANAEFKPRSDVTSS